MHREPPSSPSKWSSVSSPRRAGSNSPPRPAVHREIEFLLAWPPDEPTQTTADYLQGYIDCLYQDADGKWHLIDYKTNDVSAAACRDAAARYEMQMYVYALAAERALGAVANRTGAPFPPPRRRACPPLERRGPPPRHRTGERRNCTRPNSTPEL